VPEKKQKNRRYRGAKISEYRLRKLVICFAKGLSIKDAAATCNFSEPTVRDIYMRLRQHLFDHGFMRVSRRDDQSNMPARAIFARKHRGVPQKYAHLFESEVLHRIYFTKNGHSVRRFSAKRPDDMKALQKFINYNKLNPKYELIEIVGKTETGSLITRPFDPADYKDTSVIVVNEINMQPYEIFFRYLWGMLLQHPL